MEMACVTLPLVSVLVMLGLEEPIVPVFNRNGYFSFFSHSLPHVISPPYVMCVVEVTVGLVSATLLL